MLGLRELRDYPIQNINRGGMFGNQTQIADAIAFIHMIRFPVSEPKRLLSSQQHLRRMIALSRQSWQEIEAETDNKEDWLPNANQTSVPAGAYISQERITVWKEFLDEADDRLTGKNWSRTNK